LMVVCDSCGYVMEQYERNFREISQHTSNSILSCFKIVTNYSLCLSCLCILSS
jgi:hypothetical protein